MGISKRQDTKHAYPAFESSRTSLGTLCILVAGVGAIGAQVTRVAACVAITNESRVTRATNETSL